MDKVQALLVVDVQNDFCPGGKLAVPEGDSVVPVLNRYMTLFSKEGLPVFASRDWHPRKTKHFKQYGGKWPDHCVQRTKGAQFHPDLSLPPNTIVISKGTDPEKDSYSVFLGENAAGKSFADVLKDSAVEELFVGGLATDYCVRHTVLDALASGYKVNLLIDAVKGVDQEDSRHAVQEMIRSGARKKTFDEVSEDIHRPVPRSRVKF